MWISGSRATTESGLKGLIGLGRGRPVCGRPLFFLIAVLVYVLTRQEAVHLLRTGGITAVATLYWIFYLRPRRDTRWLVSIPEDARS